MTSSTPAFRLTVQRRTLLRVLLVCALLIGLAGPTFSSTFGANGLNGTVGGGLLAPLFQGKRLAMQEQAAKDSLAEAVANYQQTVLTAWHEVSDAAVGVRKLHEVAVQQMAQVGAARTAERLARLRYEGGVSAYLDVLDAQRSLFNAELSLAKTQRDERVAMIQLYQALGGGWQEPALATTGTAPAAN